jgi:hypothetical protein
MKEAQKTQAPFIICMGDTLEIPLPSILGTYLDFGFWDEIQISTKKLIRFVRR